MKKIFSHSRGIMTVEAQNPPTTWRQGVRDSRSQGKVRKSFTLPTLTLHNPSSHSYTPYHFSIHLKTGDVLNQAVFSINHPDIYCWTCNRSPRWWREYERSISRIGMECRARSCDAAILSSGWCLWYVP